MNFDKLKPLLEALDQICRYNKPVLIHAHLIPLFKEHCGLEEIKLIPWDGKRIIGLHLSAPAEKRLVIYHKHCPTHDPDDVEASCPDCQDMRFVIAKELIHALDGNGHRSSAADATKTLIDQLLREAWAESLPGTADFMGGIWAGELLMRYKSRWPMHGGGVLAPGMLLIQARANSDFSYIARQFCVPQDVVRHLLSDRYMSAMKQLRQALGLPVMWETLD